MINRLYSTKSTDNIKRGAEILKKGGVIIHPTETVYGFASNALIANSIRSVDKIKKRSLKETYLILIKNREMAEKLKISFNKLSEKLATTFWPAPLTLILPIDKESPLINMSYKGTVAVRVSSDMFVQQLFKIINFPIISTSANKSGELPVNDPQKLSSLFSKSVDMIFDRGVIDNNKPSTIVSTANNSINIIRKGIITEEELYAT